MSLRKIKPALTFLTVTKFRTQGLNRVGLLMEVIFNQPKTLL